MLIEDKVKLWRDYFYGRQNAFANKVFDEKIKKQKYSPVLKKYDGTTLEDKFEPLNDDHVKSHIEGYMELMIYLLNDECKVKFAAIDFDLNHTFEDVVKAYAIINGHHEFPCAMARSTRKGYHLYMFFEDFIDAKIVVSYVRHVYEVLGWMDELANGIRALPETFPKTISLGQPHINQKGVFKYPLGFGVKPPMWGPGLKNDKNCWVDGKDRPIGGYGESPAQWQYLSSIEKIESDDLVSFMEKHNIPIIEQRLSEKRGMVNDVSIKTPSSVPYEIPEKGDFNRILKGCPALERLWFHTPKKNVTHMHHVAILSHALQCNNGVEMVEDYWRDPSTGELSEEAIKQIEYAKETNQRPWTCVTMQRHGACIIGKDPKKTTGKHVHSNTGEILNDYCFERIPPKEIKNGTRVTNPDNVPKEMWPDPSPVRLKSREAKWGLLDLTHEIEELNKDDPQLEEKIAEIMLQIQLIEDPIKKDELTSLVKKQKVQKAKIIDDINKKVKAERKLEKRKEKEEEKERLEKRKEEINRALEKDPDVGEMLNCRFRLLENNKGYAQIIVGKKGEVEIQEITNFTIELTKEVTKQCIFSKPQKIIQGSVRCSGVTSPFEMNAELYGSNSVFSQTIFGVAGSHIVFDQKHLDKIRSCILLFGQKNMVRESIYEDHGFAKEGDKIVYRSGNLNISSEGIFEIEDGKTVIDENSYGRFLGLTKISDEDFEYAIRTILNDYLAFDSPMVMYTALAHAFQASVHSMYHDTFLSKKTAPILWIQGVAGTGKSVIASFNQQFYGAFPHLMQIKSTVRAMEQETMFFKDALLVLDDFKEGAFSENRNSILSLFQGVFDRSPRLRLQKNLRHAVAPFCRGLIMVTSEDIFSGEASVISRSIVLRTQNKTSNQGVDDALLDRVTGAQDLFRGVVARFIHFMLRKYPKSISLKERFYNAVDSIKSNIRGASNDHRISNNLAGNFLTWELLMEFLLESKMITVSDYQTYVEAHRGHMHAIAMETSSLCGQELAGRLFISTLNQAVLSGEAWIEELNDIDTKSNAIKIGFLEKSKANETPVICLIPDVCVRLVRKVMREKGSPMSHGTDAIGMQLMSLGFITKVTKNGPTYRKTHNGSRNFVWCIDGKKTGFIVTDDSDTALGQADINQVNSNVIGANFDQNNDSNPDKDFWSLKH